MISDQWLDREKVEKNLTSRITKGELITDIKYISLARKYKAIKQEDVEANPYQENSGCHEKKSKVNVRFWCKEFQRFSMKNYIIDLHDNNSNNKKHIKEKQ